MINFFKRFLFNRNIERAYDFIIYLKYRFIHRYIKIIKFYKPYKLNYNKDIIITIYCGVGDFLYGIPAFKEIKKKLQVNNKKFIVYVGSADNNYNNSSLIHIIKQLNIFDKVHSFHSPRPIYWKCLNLGDIIYDENKANIYHFVYTANGYGEKSRIQEVFKQFSLKYTKGLEQSVQISNDIDTKLQTIINNQNKSSKCVFLHLDTRSGEYIYPYTLQLINYLLKDGFSVVLFTNLSGITNQQNKLRYDLRVTKNKTPEIEKQIIEIEKNKILLNKITEHQLFIEVISKNINDTLKMLQDINPYVIAVNSIFWPLTNITETKLLAIHYINSNDGHKFFHNKMQFITANKFSYKKIKKLDKTKCTFSTKDNYDIDKKYGYINYHPEYIMFAFKRFIANNE